LFVGGFFMKKFLTLILPFLFGGCLSISSEVVLPKDQPDCESVAINSQSEGSSFSKANVNSGQEFDFFGNLVSFASSSAPLEDLATPEIEDVNLLPKELKIADPETIEDNLLLSDESQTPPEDEGKSVTADEITFDFPVVENEKVRYFIKHYTGPGKTTFTRWLQRSGRYLPLMRRIFREEGLPQDLAYLAMVESGFNTNAYSWAHAVGPWQFIESTGKGFGLQNGWWLDERRDFEKSTRAAAMYLKSLYQRFDGNWYLAVASYNSGAGKISRAIKKYKTRDFWELSRGKYLKDETKNYVPKLLAVLRIAKEPGKYGFTNLKYFLPLEYDVARVPTATDLEVIAKLCETSYEKIKDLNPELKRWCTPPGVKNYQVRIPGGTFEVFTEKYAQLPVKDRANYKRHQVCKGDTLLALAQHYRIRLDDIIALNDIRNPKALRIGSDLILPLKKGYSRYPMEELKDDYIRTRRKTYTVCKGDSLWEIAQRFNVTEKQLRVWNRLGWSNIIRPGQTLTVSTKAGKVRKDVSKKQSSLCKIVYRVRTGDTLWGIGRQFEIATCQIMEWNKLSADHVLRPGDKLTLMVYKDLKG
jgi:membrane-bound lytic murein transglycosylase D